MSSARTSDARHPPSPAEATDTPALEPGPPREPRLGPLGWGRWIWRQLTSMRTALVLLLLLALAALPGSVFPQRSLDPARTATWIAEHPGAGPVLDRLGFFGVYASPWFAAIYLLLFISLIGCVLPRARAHIAAWRRPPPRPPRHLTRLPASASQVVAGAPADVLAGVEQALRGQRYRVHSHEPGTLSAERGYTRELGNVVFHLSLIGVLVGVAIGHLWGWKADVIVPAGTTFVSTPARYDTPINGGPWVDKDRLQPFVLAMNRVDATFESQVQGRGQLGMPRDFVAHVTYQAGPQAPKEKRTIEVNHPLETGTATVFLLGNGYAARVTVKDTRGDVLYSDLVPFLPLDRNYKSSGAIKVPAADPQLGFAGLLLPTAELSDAGPVSLFPQAIDPALALTPYRGELFPGGRPQSIFNLDTSRMTPLTNAQGTDKLRLWLKPGQSATLPDGLGTITFDEVVRWAGLSVRHDPGKGLTLGSALLALTGLIAGLVVKRRRVFVRVAPAPVDPAGAAGAGQPDVPPRTLVTVGALAKDDDDTLAESLADLLADPPPGPSRRSTTNAGAS